MLQFSLRSLLVAVAVVAIGTTALLNANTWWASGLFAAEILLLFFAGIEVIFRRGQSAFWIGYLLAGSLYLLVLMTSFTNELGSPLHYRTLPTTNVIVWVYSWLPDSAKMSHLTAPAAPGGGSGSMAGMMPGGIYGSGPPGSIYSAPPGIGGMPGMMGMAVTLNPSYVDLTLFIQIGHAIFAVCLAWLGGTVAHWRYGKREARSPANGQ
jgi:hypothetical protein